jgi:hypothetical protein
MRSEKTDERREGDERDFRQPGHLHFWPAHGQPFRWLPRHGEPICIAEWMSQKVIRGVAFLPIYTAVVVTIALIAQLWWG